MRKNIIILLTFFVMLKSWAADPMWSVTPSSYSYSMTVTAVLDVDCIELTNPSNRLGAFVGADVRGSVLSSTVVNGRYIALMTVYSNTISGEDISFKIYDADTDAITDAITILEFQDDGSYGTPSFPHLITNNHAPTDLTLSISEMDENNTSGSAVGTLSAMDEDVADSHTYSLVAGDGDDDNAVFSISSDQLILNEVANYEVRSSYSVRVRVQDNGGCGVENAFNIEVLDLNEAPTDLSLSNASVDEGTPGPVEIGILSSVDEDTDETFNYTLEAGTGDDDNTAFTIDDNRLLLSSTPDFETQSSYSVLVRTTDLEGAFFENVFEILVTDLNEPPYDMTLTAESIAENQPTGTVIGQFGISDDDSPETFTFEFIEGENDNDLFSISGNDLSTGVEFDFEEENEFVIHVKGTDSGGEFTQLAFTITITDETEAPTDISISQSSLSEGQEAPLQLATLISEDEDLNESFTYDLVAGTGDTDNGSFFIDEDKLFTAVSFDYETQTSYSILLQVEDKDNLTFTKAFTIEVLDVNEAPYDLDLNVTTIAENQPSGTVIGVLTATDDDTDDVVTFSLAEATDNDNGLFTIVDDELQNIEPFNFEEQNEYFIVAIATDSKGATTEMPFTIEVTNENDLPTDLIFSSTSFVEDQPVGTEVGTFSVNDEDDGDTHTFSLDNSSGSNDNQFFRIEDNSLVSAEVIDFSESTSLTVEVAATDNAGGSVTQQFTIEIVEVSNTQFPSIDIVTPNGDGINDNWTIQNVQNYSNFSVKIFDSSGQVIFFQDGNYQNNWNGDGLAIGTYYYVVESKSDKSKSFSGTISLIK